MEHEALPQHRSLNILPSAPHPTRPLMEVEPSTNNVRVKKRYYWESIKEHFGNLREPPLAAPTQDPKEKN
jgi:hypothetical protein